MFYGNQAHLLDAAHYVKAAWDTVSPGSIRNCFVKADIMSLDPVPDTNLQDDDIEIANAF